MPLQVEFSWAGVRKVRAVFDGGPISSDGGAPLLRQVDRRIGLVDALAAVLPDSRDPRFVEHSIADLIRQRVYGIALGYEDCNDATTLRRDPVLKTCCDREPFRNAISPVNPRSAASRTTSDRRLATYSRSNFLSRTLSVTRSAPSTRSSSISTPAMTQRTASRSSPRFTRSTTSTSTCR